MKVSSSFYLLLNRRTEHCAQNLESMWNFHKFHIKLWKPITYYSLDYTTFQEVVQELNKKQTCFEANKLYQVRKVTLTYQKAQIHLGKSLPIEILSIILGIMSYELGEKVTEDFMYNLLQNSLALSKLSYNCHSDPWCQCRRPFHWIVLLHFSLASGFLNLASSD